MNSFILFCIFIRIICIIFSCIFFLFCIPSYTSLFFIKFCVLLKNSSISRYLNSEWPTQCAGSLLFFKHISWRHAKWIFLSSRILGFIHPSLFRCIWNFQSHHSWFASVSLLFILFSSSFFSLINFLFFIFGRLCPIFFTYQPHSISCNNYLRFSFGMGLLGSLTRVF